MLSLVSEADRRKSELKFHFQAAEKPGPASILFSVQAYEKCLFIEGVASPADYMALVFRRRCDVKPPYKYGDEYRYDIWLPLELWSIVADFVAPTRPLSGVTDTDKHFVHVRLANLCSNISTSGPDCKRWLYEETLHHHSAIIDLNKLFSRRYRITLHLRNNQFIAALADCNHDLFNREQPLPPKDTEALYRQRSEALFGMKDVQGAIDSRMNAVRVSADVRHIEADMVQIEKWRELCPSLLSRPATTKWNAHA
jgi:hypothetical protein